MENLLRWRDFESIMDKFLNDFEILGQKMKARLAGDMGESLAPWSIIRREGDDHLMPMTFEGMSKRLLSSRRCGP